MDRVDSVGTSVTGQGDPTRPQARKNAGSKTTGSVADSNANVNRDASTTSADPASKASKKPKSKWARWV